MTPLRLLGSTTLALSLTLSALPAFSAITTGGRAVVPGLTGGVDALVVDVKQGRSGTGERGRDRDRSSDDSRSDDRGRGRGSDDGPGDDNGRRGDDRGFNGGVNGGGSGRDRTRIPGGSGCDDPRDLIEHPECLLGKVIIGQ